MDNTEATINPFPGLRPFEEDEEYLFFGREKSVTELLSRLRNSHFLTLIGTSGCGKSSLIRAGLFPSLYRGFMARAGSDWRVALFRPGDNPIGNMADALAGAGILSEDSISRKFIETTLRRSNSGLIEIVRQARLPQYENLLIVVDQFEELFRFSRLERSYRDGERDSADFVDLLLECSGQQGIPIYVILAMRSDYLGHCTEFRGLPEAINNSQYLIPRMTREELRSAVAGPIKVGGAEASSTLLSRLLNDVGDNPDQLPIMQHALMRTWDYWAQDHKRGESLALKHYEAIGTMERALSRHAEEALAELKTVKEQVICEKMFKLLTDSGETDRGVRRPTKISEICRVTKTSEKEVIKVINAFRQPGRTFLMPPIKEKLRGNSVIDISHESLMRIWTRLIRWVKEEAKSAELYLHLAKTAALCEVGKAALFRNPELMLALKWRDENKPNAEWAERYDPSFDRATQFLEASKEQQELEIREKEKLKKIRTIRIYSIIISITAVISIILTIWALNSRKVAENALIIAESERKKAEGLRKIAVAEKEEAKKQKEKADDERYKAEIARSEADENAEKAEKARIKSKIEERKAKENAIESQVNRLIVAMKKEEAKFGQNLAKAKELAVISIAQTSDEELKALLALTASRLNSDAYQRLDQSTEGLFEEFNKTILEKFGGREELEKLTGVFKELDKEYKRLQEKSKKYSVPADIFVSLRDAYILREDSEDKIYPAESWALAVTFDNKLVFNDREGKLSLAPLQSEQSEVFRLPGINKNAVTTLMENGNGILRATSFARSGKRLFCGTKQGHIVDWGNSYTGKSKLRVKHPGPILSMVYSKNKECLVYSFKNMIYMNNLKDKARLIDEFEVGNFIRTLALVESESPKNSFLIAADSAGKILYYSLLEDIKRNALNSEFTSNPFHAIAFNSARNMLVLGDAEGRLYLLSSVNPQNLTSNTGIEYYPFYRNHKGIVRALAFSSSGRYLASGSFDGTVMLWDLEKENGKEQGWKNVDKITRQEPILTFDNRLKILSLAFITRTEGDEKKEEEYMILNDGQYLRICPTNPEVFNKKLLEIEKREINKRKEEAVHKLLQRLKQYIDDNEEHKEIIKSLLRDIGLEWRER